MITKKCTVCGEIKALTQYHKDKSRRDGHYVVCKTCACKKAVLYAQSHKEIKREYDREYRAKNQSKLVTRAKNWLLHNPVKRKVTQKRYRDNHAEQISASHKERRNRDIAKSRAYEQKQRDASRAQTRKRLREWKRNHPESVRADKENRRAKQANAPGKFTSGDIERMYSVQDGVCIYHDLNPSCLVDLNFAYHIDHIVPIVRGGSNYPDNLQLLCHLCNEAKGRKTDKEFRDWLAYVYPK